MYELYIINMYVMYVFTTVFWESPVCALELVIKDLDGRLASGIRNGFWAITFPQN